MGKLADLITKHLKVLSEKTNCSTLILAEFGQYFDTDKRQKLGKDYIQTEKSYKFWEAVQSHEENISIEILIKAFENQKQSGVVMVLKEIQAELRGSLPQYPMASTSTLPIYTTNEEQNQESSNMEICAETSNPFIPIRDYIKSLEGLIITTDSLPKDFKEPVVTRPNEKMSFEDDDYELPTGFKGLLLLINILKYKEAEQFRKGAAVDTRRLKVVFEALGYEVVCATGPEKIFTKEVVSNIIEKFKARCALLEVSSIAVFLGAHGEEGILQLSDETTLTLETEVFSKLCTAPENYPDALGTQHWINLPKMFFIQACRDVVPDKPTYPNCLISYACESGKPAFRNPISGSWYVEALTKVLAASAYKMDLCTMLDLVRDEVFGWARHKGKSMSDAQKPEYSGKESFKKLYFNMLPF